MPEAKNERDYMVFVSPQAALSSSCSLDERGGMMMLCRCTAWASVLFALCSPADAAKLTTFKVPGATNTVSYAINSKGEVSGWWTSSDGVAHGFIRDAQGVITTFDLPGKKGPTVEGVAINRKGAVTGAYRHGKKRTRAFLRRGDGSIMAFYVPGAAQTVPYGINAAGEIAGTYSPPRGSSERGFVRDKKGRLTEFAVPNCIYTSASGLNGSGTIAGTGGLCPIGHDVGFVRTPDGAIEAFTVNNTDTVAYAINDASTVTGTAINPDATRVGFVRAPDGTVTTFSVSGFSSTEGRAINSSGTITGIFDAGGFVRSADGTITTFAAPREVYTWPGSINDNGEVVGTAQDSSGKTVGFIWRP